VSAINSALLFVATSVLTRVNTFELLGGKEMQNGKNKLCDRGTSTNGTSSIGTIVGTRTGVTVFMSIGCCGDNPIVHRWN
jgi:hypothetical protein